MIQIFRLSKIHGNARLRKCALLLEKAERGLFDSLGKNDSIQGGHGSGHDSSDHGGGGESRDDHDIGGELRSGLGYLQYARGIAEFLRKEAETPAEIGEGAGLFLALTDDAELNSKGGPGTLRALNDFRHLCMRVSGQAPADWDLYDYVSARSGGAEDRIAAVSPASPPSVREYYPGMRVYLEDIRSPFNVGTIIRTAEALGFEEVLLSPHCADPRHPRALRSSMGAVGMIPWRSCSPDELPGMGPAFALELGGTALESFHFPPKGVLILGSEELGVSSGALALADCGRISIPMKGIKASINVAVAFGIAASAWVSEIAG